MTDNPVAVVTHYYNKIGVAVVKVAKPLKIGDKIKIVGRDYEFVQQISSIQFEHQSIREAKKGEAVGLKVDQPVREKDKLYKVVYNI